MAKMIQIPLGDVSVPKATAQDVQTKINGVENEQSLKLSALGLLVNLASYPPTWELNKTELYSRFAKDKETSVKTAWKDLENANYIVEFKYRVGKKYEYVYYFRMVPFTEEEKAQILAEAEKEYGEIWRLDFQDPKMESSKPRGKLNTSNQLKSFNKKEEEDIIQAFEEHPSFQELPHYFPMMQNIFDKTDLKDIVEALKHYECYEFVGKDIKAAYKKTLENIETVDVPALFFAKVLSNEVKKTKITKVRQALLEEQREKAAQRDTSFYYNWLEE